jgi:hypothetical protein
MVASNATTRTTPSTMNEAASTRIGRGLSQYLRDVTATRSSLLIRHVPRTLRTRTSSEPTKTAARMTRKNRTTRKARATPGTRTIGNPKALMIKPVAAPTKAKTGRETKKSDIAPSSPVRTEATPRLPAGKAQTPRHQLTNATEEGFPLRCVRRISQSLPERVRPTEVPHIAANCRPAETIQAIVESAIADNRGVATMTLASTRTLSDRTLRQHLLVIGGPGRWWNDQSRRSPACGGPGTSRPQPRPGAPPGPGTTGGEFSHPVGEVIIDLDRDPGRGTSAGRPVRHDSDSPSFSHSTTTVPFIELWISQWYG